MLPDQDRAQLRTLILEEIQKLESSLEGLREGAKPVAPDNSIGRITRMDSIVNKSTAENVLAESNRRLAQLKDRLAKIDDPDYGICRKCKLPIPLPRLQAAPDAIFCVPCAESLTRKRR